MSFLGEVREWVRARALYKQLTTGSRTSVGTRSWLRDFKAIELPTTGC